MEHDSETAFWLNPDTRWEISGWVVDPLRLDHSVPVQLWVGGQLVAKVRANRHKAGVARRFGGDGRHGFRIIPPMRFFDAGTYPALLVNGDTDRVLTTFDLATADLRLGTDGDWYGAVLQVNERSIGGWALDELSPATPATVELLVDGAPVSTQIADVALSILPFKDNNNRHGFEFRIPARFYDGAAHHLAVRLRETGVILPAPINSLLLHAAARPNWSSSLSSTADGMLNGLVTAKPDGGAPVVLSLYSGGELIQAIRVKSGVAFEANVLAQALTKGITLAGGLRVVFEPDGERLPVDGPDPLAAIVRLAGVALDETTIQFVLESNGAERTFVQFALLVNGKAVGSQDVVLEDGRDAVVSFDLPSAPQLIELVLGDGVTPICSGSFRIGKASDPHEATHAGSANASLWIDPSSPDVKTILSAWANGLIPVNPPTAYSGSWLLDHEAKIITGWVVNLADESRPIDVELVVDGAAVGRAKAIDMREMKLGGKQTGLAAGFHFNLTDLQFKHNEVSTIAVRIIAAPLIAFGTPVAYHEGRRWIGKIEHVAWRDFRLEVTGWVDDLNGRGRPVEVELREGHAQLARAVAYEKVDAALSEASRITAFGFTLTCLCGSPEVLSRLSVSPLGASIAWPLPPLETESTDQKAAALPRRAAPPARPDDVIRGLIEKIDATGVEGWALNSSQPESVPDLILRVDGEPLAYQRPDRHRGDMEAGLGVSVCSGFHFEMPRNIGWVATYDVRVEPSTGVGEIKAGGGQKGMLAHVIAADMPRPADEFKLPERPTDHSCASLIVTEPSGSEALRELLRSAALHERSENIEWIVIGDRSSEALGAVCTDAKSNGVDIRFIPKTGSRSVGALGNLGAVTAKHNRLVFLSGNLKFKEVLLQELFALLADASVGVVGTKLCEVLPGHRDATTLIQSMGVYFGPKLLDRSVDVFEARLTDEIANTAHRIVELPAVAPALLAIRREVFDAVGGFNEQYCQGYEGVDLCLKVSQGLGKKVVSLNTRAALHYRDATRSGERYADPKWRNTALAFSSQWGSQLRRKMRSDVLVRPGFWLGHRPIIGFAIAQAGDEAAGGSFEEASELGRAMQRAMPVHLAFLGRDEWSDLSGIDVLIVADDEFDLAKVASARPHLKIVAWARHAFERWCERPSIHGYDQVWASSGKAAAFMSKRLAIDVQVVRAATNPERFASAAPKAEYHSDYCFVGDRSGEPQDIEFDLKPQQIEGHGAIFGKGWENAEFVRLARGPIAYSRVPAIYASTAVVIDDASRAAKEWGGSGRVLDALGAGRLAISNGEEGSREIFGDLLPLWSDHGALPATIDYWLKHPEERARRVEMLRNLVLGHHTYDQRAKEVLQLLQKAGAPVTFAIKSAARARNSAEWGDLHFANGLAAALRALGHRARVDLRDNWYRGISETDDVVIALRGLAAYEPRAHQKNFLWIISHPDDVSPKELALYDRIFVASRPYAKVLGCLTDKPVDVMLQCTDARRFNPDASGFGAPAAEILFVGNSRSVEREAVRWAIEGELNLSVYGAGWEPFVPPSVLKGRHVPNEALADFYRKAGWVLCDHWADMKRNGFISNRVFDVLAVGGKLIVDDVAGLEDDVPHGCHVYRTRDELVQLAHQDAPSASERRATAEWILTHHSFDARARTFSDITRLEIN